KLQRWKFGTSLIGSLGYGVYSLGTKLWMALTAIFGAATQFAVSAGEFALLAPLGVLFGYGYKQYAGYQITKQTYAKMLTESLYYQTLDNNGGVLTHILDEAEEQECREAILAYYCLLRFAPPQGWTAEQLDDYVGMYLEG